MVLYRTKKEVTQSLPQPKLLPTKQGDYMILLKPLKVNSNSQVFKFKSELFNLNKINIVKREIKRYEEECNYGYIECPCCGSDKLTFHGSYERNVIIYNECRRIKIKRVMCKECGKTHALIPYFLIPYYQHEKTFIYRVCIEKILKETGVCKLSSKVEISRQLLYQWNKIFVIHIRYLLTTLSRSLKLSLEYLINESLCDDLYERVNKMYFLKKIPT